MYLFKKIVMGYYLNHNYKIVKSNTNAIKLVVFKIKKCILDFCMGRRDIKKLSMK